MTNRAGNVLFITADQWRGDCLSALGHPCLRTPQLDALAHEGVIFSRHYAQASPCGPSRASLYTGLYLHNHRSVVNGTPLDPRHTNVALEARKAGYEPALFGYTDVSADPRQHHPSDPSLKSYEGVLPGMVPVVWMKDTPLQWIAELKSRGYEITPAEAFKPKSDFPGAASRGATFAPARFAAADSNTAFLVWTPTPWTLPSNLALAVGPDIDYVYVDHHGETLVLAKALLDTVLGEGDHRIIRQVKGRDLVDLRYQRLFDYLAEERKICRVHAGEFVSTADGTGIVHVAPAYGVDDLELGQRKTILLAKSKLADRINGILQDKTTLSLIEIGKNNNLSISSESKIEIENFIKKTLGKHTRYIICLLYTSDAADE